MMGDKFPLLEQIVEHEKNPAAVSPLPKGIRYNEYTLTVDEEETKIFIPLKEAVAFEETLDKEGKYLSREQLATLLRKHRGIRNWE